MQETKKTAGILEDLILVNNDRLKGYKKALDWFDDSSNGITEIFEEFIEQSQFHVEELRERLRLLGTEDGVDSGTVRGSLKRVFLDLKFTLTGSDIMSVLAGCESIEDDVQEAYMDALDKSADMPQDIRGMIEWQKHSLMGSLTRLKKYRDDPSFGLIK